MDGGGGGRMGRNHKRGEDEDHGATAPPVRAARRSIWPRRAARLPLLCPVPLLWATTDLDQRPGVSPLSSVRVCILFRRCNGARGPFRLGNRNAARR